MLFEIGLPALEIDGGLAFRIGDALALQMAYVRIRERPYGIAGILYPAAKVSLLVIHKELRVKQSHKVRHTPSYHQIRTDDEGDIHLLAGVIEDSITTEEDFLRKVTQHTAQLI